MMEHGLGPFGRADLHPRRNPLDRQGRFAPQPGSDGQLGGGAVRSLRSKVQGPKLGRGRSQDCCQTTARKFLRDDAVGPLLGSLPVQLAGVVFAQLSHH